MVFIVSPAHRAICWRVFSMSTILLARFSICVVLARFSICVVLARLSLLRCILFEGISELSSCLEVKAQCRFHVAGKSSAASRAPSSRLRFSDEKAAEATTSRFSSRYKVARFTSRFMSRSSTLWASRAESAMVLLDEILRLLERSRAHLSRTKCCKFNVRDE